MSDAWINNTERSDGLYVHQLANETWAIRPGKAQPVDCCPACARTFKSVAEAQIAADILYPVADPPRAA